VKSREVGEIWRRVVRFPDLYEVSSDGRVRSIDGRLIVRSDGVSQRRPGRILRHRSKPSGHQTVKLDHGKHAYVHVLVLEAFVGPRPPDAQACHNDGDPTNNVPANLRWDTRAANTLDSVRHGTHPQARKEVCKRGHPLQGANLIKSAVNPTWRGCLACRKAHNARRQRGRVLRNFDGIDMQAEADRQFARIMMEAS